jgi:hypothetical protein
VAKYILIQSQGALKVDPTSGDGAYAEWMLRYFTSQADQCVAFARLVFPGGNAVNKSTITTKFKKDLDAELSRLNLTSTVVDDNNPDTDAMEVDQQPSDTAQTVILNWHIRFTGRPNSQTGRGMGDGLIQAFRALCQKNGKQAKVVYTIHEEEGVNVKHLIAADALVALNSTIGSTVKEWADSVGAAYCLSKVPNLAQSEAARIVDKIRGYLSLSTQDPSLLSFANAISFQKLRAAPIPSRKGAPVHRGIVIFGSITGRHGLSVESVQQLCALLDQKGLPVDFHVLIAGKTTDQLLATKLDALADKTPRLFFLGGVDNDFSELDGVRYALSMDPLGFRTNASAMVNMVTNGILLFNRSILKPPGNGDNDLIRYACEFIAKCEATPSGNSGAYNIALEKQQSLYGALSSAAVGAELDRMFAAIASSPRRSPPNSRPTTPVPSRSSSPAPAGELKRMRLV